MVNYLGIYVGKKKQTTMDIFMKSDTALTAGPSESITKESIGIMEDQSSVHVIALVDFSVGKNVEMKDSVYVDPDPV